MPLSPSSLGGPSGPGSAPALLALLERLVLAERAVRRRCTLVGSRLGIAASSLMPVLRLACHVDAALDDLGSLADARGASLRGVGMTLRTCGDMVFEWLSEVWPQEDTASLSTSAIVTAVRREMAVADSLRAAALAARDGKLASWCALWIDQRARLADGLAASVAASGEPSGRRSRHLPSDDGPRMAAHAKAASPPPP